MSWEGTSGAVFRYTLSACNANIWKFPTTSLPTLKSNCSPDRSQRPCFRDLTCDKISGQRVSWPPTCALALAVCGLCFKMRR